jgi:hypothetical protein
MNDENEELGKLKNECSEKKRAILHFYYEITRLKKNEPRKYTFPITVETCIETIGQCYEYIDLLDKIRSLDSSNDEIEYDLDAVSTYLTVIESFSHEISNSNEKPTEILTDKNAIQVTSPSPDETKGNDKKKEYPSNTQEDQIINHDSMKLGRNEQQTIILPEEKEKTGSITEVINGNDVSKKELYQITDIEKPIEKDTPKILPVKDFIDIEVAQETKTEPIENTVKDNSVKQENNEMLKVLQPEENSINLQVVLEKDSEKKLEKSDDSVLSDNVPFLTEEDIKNDGMDKVEEDSLDDIELINEEDNDELNDGGIDGIPKDLLEHNIKAISRSKVNGFKARLQRKNIDEKLISDIKLFPYNENDENIRKEYLLSHNNMIASANVARITLLMSGYFCEIASYGNFDTITLERIMRNKQNDFVDKEIIILNSIYDHIKYFSYTQSKPTFEEWLDSVKYPDYDTIFFGLFDANYQGINYFKAGCPYCGNDEIVVGRETKDLAVAIDHNYTDESLVEQITAKEMNKLDTHSYLPKWANSTRIRKMTPNTKILFVYQVPTLLDYVQTLTTLRRISARDNKPIDLSQILTPGSEEYLRLVLYLYIKTVGLPNPIYGDPSRPKEPTSYKYIGLTNKADIIETINSLDVEDYTYLFRGESIRELLFKRSMYFYVKDIVCTNSDCGKTIKYVNLDPRSIFFSKTTEVIRTLMF